MISVEFNGAIYEGRLISLIAQEQCFTAENGISTFKNYGYHLTLMDAFGAEIRLCLTDLNQITFVG